MADKKTNRDGSKGAKFTRGRPESGSNPFRKSLERKTFKDGGLYSSETQQKFFHTKPDGFPAKGPDGLGRRVLMKEYRHEGLNNKAKRIYNDYANPKREKDA